MQHEDGGKKERDKENSNCNNIMRPTYFRRAFVFDGKLALPLAVIDVAELVVEQVRG